VRNFQPYVLRHTALTNLAKYGADAYTLARIAGHSSIVITMRYVHPQADSIERAFALAHGTLKSNRSLKRVGALQMGGHKLEGVGTKLGTVNEAHKISSPDTEK
jgi:hypothetical protein